MKISINKLKSANESNFELFNMMTLCWIKGIFVLWVLTKSNSKS